MGREATANCRWRGETGTATLLLEADALLMRGRWREGIALSAIGPPHVEGAWLVLPVGDAELAAELGPVAAARWAEAVAAPPRSLADKMGVGPDRPAWLIGTAQDVALVDALTDARAATADGAAMLVAELRTPADLAGAADVAAAHPDLPLWCVYRKGSDAPVGDAAVRAYLRERGWVDTKTCAVSAAMTATRYGRRREPAA